MLKNPKKRAAKSAEKLTPEQEAELERATRVLVAGGATVGRAGALLRIAPRVTDRRTMDEVIGPVTCSTIEELAFEFGVTVSEIKEWQRQGMPGPMTAEQAAEKNANYKPSEYWPPNSRQCELIRVLRPANLYINDLIVLLAGDIHAKTQDEVAKAFAVSVQTIKVWVAKGMPKPTRKGDPYQLIQILHWRCREDERADENQRRQY